MPLVSTLTGNGAAGFADGTGGATGTTEFNQPYDVALDGQGNLYVADWANNRIRKIAPDGTTSTLAGNGTPGFANGTGGPSGTAEFNGPEGLAVDSQGNVYVADTNNGRIRMVTPSGATTTLSGEGTSGFRDGPGSTALFFSPTGVAVDGQGHVYVADYNNSRIRVVAPDGTTSTLAGNGTVGFVDGTGGPSGTAEFHYPHGVAVDGQGKVYVADFGSGSIRVVAPGGSTTTLSGNGTPGYVDGPGSTAEFGRPGGVAVDGQGNVYVADFGNYRIRLVAPDGSTSTLAGDGNYGYVDGLPVGAEFEGPYGVAVDGQRRVYVADWGNNRIRVVTP